MRTVPELSKETISRVVPLATFIVVSTVTHPVHSTKNHPASQLTRLFARCNASSVLATLKDSTLDGHAIVQRPALRRPQCECVSTCLRPFSFRTRATSYASLSTSAAMCYGNVLLGFGAISQASNRGVTPTNRTSSPYTRK